MRCRGMGGDGVGRAQLPDASVAVHDAVPISCHGLTVALRQHGVAVHTPPCLVGWVTSAGDAVIGVVIMVRHRDDLQIVQRVRAARRDLPILALLPDASLAAVQNTVSAGATSVVPWDAPLDSIMFSLETSLRGLTVVPVDTAQELCRRPVASHASVRLREAERRWLSRLAAGVAVADLADEEGYSSREMFRLLAASYRRIGATNRHEAIALAAMSGCLDLEVGTAAPARAGEPRTPAVAPRAG
jgi:DNA-binding NarL/FixJ family response regulator